MSIAAVPIPGEVPREELFGRYRIKRRVAMGGMAEVFDAELQGPLGFRRRVALKRILPHLARDNAFVRSFVSEARVCGLLIHPHIVQIVDFDFVGEVPYIAMEYVEGGHLGRLVERARRTSSQLPAEMVTALLSQLIRGIDYAHRATDPDGNKLDLIHRDLKPPNVLLGLDGVAKIGDFGIARASSNLTHTMPDMVKGSLPYMSPEQARGATLLTPASDLFAIGAILYELLTLERLFPPGPNAFGMLSLVAHGPSSERLSKLEAVRPPASRLVPLLKRLLQVKPKNRFLDAASLLTAVERLEFPVPSSEAIAEFAREWLAPSHSAEEAFPGLEGRPAPVPLMPAPPPLRLEADVAPPSPPVLLPPALPEAVEFPGRDSGTELPLEASLTVPSPPQGTPTLRMTRGQDDLQTTDKYSGPLTLASAAKATEHDEDTTDPKSDRPSPLPVVGGRVLLAQLPLEPPPLPEPPPPPATDLEEDTTKAPPTIALGPSSVRADTTTLPMPPPFGAGPIQARSNQSSLLTDRRLVLFIAFGLAAVVFLGWRLGGWSLSSASSDDVLSHTSWLYVLSDSPARQVHLEGLLVGNTPLRLHVRSGSRPVEIRLQEGGRLVGSWRATLENHQHRVVDFSSEGLVRSWQWLETPSQQPAPQSHGGDR